MLYIQCYKICPKKFQKMGTIEGLMLTMLTKGHYFETFLTFTL